VPVESTWHRLVTVANLVAAIILISAELILDELGIELIENQN
jgi:hypothetical protein